MTTFLGLAALAVTTVLLSLSAVVFAGEAFRLPPVSAESLEGETFLLHRKKVDEKERLPRQTSPWPTPEEYRSGGGAAFRPDSFQAAPLFILKKALLI